MSVHVPHAKEPQPAPKSWVSPLKIVGAIGATISFFLAVNQFTGVVQNFRIHHKEFREAMDAGDQAEKREDYRAAFDSFKHAIDLDPIDRKAQARETEAAMLLLENVHATAERSFTDTANTLLPVFDRALTKAKGADAADIQAHIGWANYLRYREGRREGVTIEENYKQAIEKDANNPYANAMWGHWILWQGGSLQDANVRFAAAVASGRHRAYVRELQLGALHNSQNDDTDAALIVAVNDMRKNGEPLSDAERRSILWDTISVRVHDRDRLVKILSSVPENEMEPTFHLLNDSSAPDERKIDGSYIIANLREMAGDRAQALSLYQALQKSLKGSRSTMVGDVDAAVKRTSDAKSK